jgi:hypothetical protein
MNKNLRRWKTEYRIQKKTFGMSKLYSEFYILYSDLLTAGQLIDSDRQRYTGRRKKTIIRGGREEISFAATDSLRYFDNGCSSGLLMGADMEKRQLIEVIYPDGTSGQVSNDVLDVLIATGKILKFRRTDGWVDIIREQARLRDYRRDGNYAGQDRRSPWQLKATDSDT